MNPFRDKTMRACYDKVIAAYEGNHKDIVTPRGTRHRGNSIASMFWRGYDGIRPEQWTDADKRTMGWAYYRAGRDVRKREGDSPRFPNAQEGLRDRLK
jgi:hypothetical protein